jgi:hypothetical protein
MTGERAEHVDEQGVIVAGKRIGSTTVLWTAGVAPSPILTTLGVNTDHAGRVFGIFVAEMIGILMSYKGPWVESNSGYRGSPDAAIANAVQVPVNDPLLQPEPLLLVWPPQITIRGDEAQPLLADQFAALPLCMLRTTVAGSGASNRQATLVVLPAVRFVQS